MITFSRTHDMELVRSVMTHPKVWPFITDDFCGEAEDFQPADIPSVIYLEVRDGEQLLGIFMFAPRNGICYEVHNYLLPQFRPVSREAGIGAAKWIWDNTRAQRIVGRTPANNRRALRYAVECGMEFIGIDEKSIQIRGRLRDQVFLGMSRPQ